MRFLILIVVLLAIDFYAFQAFRTVAQHWSSTAKNILTVIFWAMPVLAVALMLIDHFTNFPRDHKATFTMLSALVFIAYLSKLVLLPVLFVDDVRRWWMARAGNAIKKDVVDVSRSRFLSQFGILISGVPFLTLMYGVVRNPYRYKVYRQKIKIEDLPEALEGLRIVQISDIHSGSFFLKDPVKHSVELVNRENPDLVFFTGDLVNDRADEMKDFMDVFDKVRAKYGIFSIFGNHDYGDYVSWPSPEAKRQNLEKLKQIHQQLGWQLLTNENRILEIRGETVAIIGVENYSIYKHFPTYGDLPKAYQGAENAQFKMLLSHDPTHWKAQVTPDFQDIAVTFSGHTHGCQFGIEIPGYIKWSPVQYLYRQWAGLYQEGKQFLYVNRGLGFIGYPGRVGILPEISVLELHKA